MYRQNVARLPKIKSRAAAAKKRLPSNSPKPVPFQQRIKLRVIEGGKSENKPFRKRELCKFCQDELDAQDADDLLEWRRQAAIFFEHLPNPDRPRPRLPVEEDVTRDMMCNKYFTGREDKSYK